MLDVILGPKMCKASSILPMTFIWDSPYGSKVTLNVTTTIVVVDFSLVIIQHSIHGFKHTTIMFLVHFATTP
jgi:hypothetical protein